MDHFKLRDAVQTGTQVESVSPKDNRWVIKTQSEGSSKEETFDYCVIATGLYSKTKLFIPEIPNKEKFQGKVRFSPKNVSKDMAKTLRSGYVPSVKGDVPKGDVVNIVNHSIFDGLHIPAIKMVLTGRWFLILLPL